MQLEILTDAQSVAQAAARVTAECARASALVRARFALAVSGGRTPWFDAAGAGGRGCTLAECAGLLSVSHRAEIRIGT
jgi:hypothetical protein